MSDPIGDLRREMEQRLKVVEQELAAVEPLVRERDRLEAALSMAPFAAPVRVAARSAPATRKTRASRAPRGANREAILKLVGERPGVGAAEISDVTKIKRAVTYNTLSKLVEQGQLVKTELPGGQTGYQPAPPTPESPPAT